MKVLSLVTGVVVTAATVVAANATPVSAAANKCEVQGVGLGQAGTSFVVTGEHITSTFTVTGQNCATPVTLAVWKSPSVNGQPIEQQKLFSHKTGYFGPGTHSLSTTLPTCFYQADLIQSVSPTAADGGANYHWQNGQFVDGGLKDYRYGGDKKCEEPKTPEQPKTPETPQPPTGGRGGAVKAAATLPATGAGSTAAVFAGVAIIAGVAHAVVRRFKRQ